MLRTRGNESSTRFVPEKQFEMWISEKVGIIQFITVYPIGVCDAKITQRIQSKTLESRIE